MTREDKNEPPRLRGPPPGATEPPEHVKQPQIYEVFHGSSSSSSRPEPEWRQQENVAGQKKATPEQPTIKEGFQSIKTDDFWNIHKVPCARESFLTGIGAGAIVGFGRVVLGARIPKAANWAFGSFVVGNIIQWEYCRAQRAKEKEAMLRVVEVMDRKQAEKKAQAVEAARLKREADEKAQQARKSWYRVW
ncbi:hypothetical protein F4778DRAFT_60273 [Xylariomycetidae sp. FL2044]|nr:hypothetical protein F4778DRAFT_60273 [Xylariomycetidae sp. FL2044]